MPSLKLTSTSIEKLPAPASGQVLYRDTEKKGLAVRVTPSGKKTFVVDKWDKEKARVARVVICDVGERTIHQAKAEADKIIGQVIAGINPVEERRKRQARGVTLGQVFESYLGARKNLAARTIYDYRRLMYGSIDPETKKARLDGRLSEWVNRPIAGIGKDDIERIHSDIGERSHAEANYAARLLRALFNFASDKYGTDDEPFLSNNPVKRLSAARAWYRIERRQTYIKPTQLKAWFEALQKEGELSRDYLHILILTGLRRGEACRLAWKNIDLQHKS
ncbi:MAG: integrase family protein, partial [Pseudomonadota bacterium]|nr:integrase family protein [Pseudomonadota bacterium]